MHKRKMLDVFFVSTFLLSVLMINVSKVNAVETTVSVQPPSQTVGDELALLPTSPFTINITVQDVTDLYGWEIVLYYNSTILNTRPDLIIVPTENIFKGKDFSSLGPYIENDTKGTYIDFGGTLVGDVPGVNVAEPGVLFQINFTGQAPGTSELNLGITAQHTTPWGTIVEFYTCLLNSNLKQIPISSIVDGQVTVIGIEHPREPSTITINVNSSSVAPGSSVIITGTINPTRVGANVTIHYRNVNLGTAGTLATVQTNAFSSYEYNWTTTEAGEYELWASWPGDADYNEATSTLAPVTVNPPTGGGEEPPPPTETTTGDMTLYYIIAAIAIIAIAAIGIYFTKIRKRQQATDK